MRIILANPRGFCAGVERAVECLRAALSRYGAPLFVYHEIVHNTWVVRAFREKGAVFVDALDEVPRGAMLMYSAHGVSPAIRREAAQQGLETIDATCPLVQKVHDDAIRLAREGYTILLIGHAGHDEVLGVMGEAPEAIRLVETAEDVDRIDVDKTSRISYLLQTTLSADASTWIIERLKERFPLIEGPPSQDICFATENRQAGVRRLASNADIVLVVGSASSSNSRRLEEVAVAAGAKTARLIDGPDDIDLNCLGADQTVVITAGASAPEWVVQRCVDLLKEHFNATVEEDQAAVERVRFKLPRELRDS